MAGNEYTELRCIADKSLLGRCRGIPTGEIEIKCRRCHKQRRFSFPLRSQAMAAASGADEKTTARVARQ